MSRGRGFVIAFHNDEKQHPYLGLTCRERAIRNLKPNLASDILRKLRKSKQEQERALSKISLEAGVINHSQEILVFIQEKTQRGENIFLDFKEKDARLHNHSECSQHFLIASMLVTPTDFVFLNPGQFSSEDVDLIVSVVERSQNGELQYRGTMLEAVS